MELVNQYIKLQGKERADAVLERISFLVEMLEREHVVKRARKGIFMENGYQIDEKLEIMRNPNFQKKQIIAELYSLLKEIGLVPGKTEIEIIEITNTKVLNK